jgi:hypothetical protein
VPDDEHASHPAENAVLQHLVLQMLLRHSEEAAHVLPGFNRQTSLESVYVGIWHAVHWPDVPQEIHPTRDMEQQRPPEHTPEVQAELWLHVNPLEILQTPPATRS